MNVPCARCGRMFFGVVEGVPFDKLVCMECALREMPPEEKERIIEGKVPGDPEALREVRRILLGSAPRDRERARKGRRQHRER